jgi:hypothetical protein
MNKKQIINKVRRIRGIYEMKSVVLPLLTPKQREAYNRARADISKREHGTAQKLLNEYYLVRKKGERKLSGVVAPYWEAYNKEHDRAAAEAFLEDKTLLLSLLEKALA